MFLFLVAIIMSVAAIRFIRRGLRPYSERRTRDIVMGSFLLAISLPVIVLNMAGIGNCVHDTIVYTNWHSFKKTEELIAEVGTPAPKARPDGKPDPLVRAFAELQRRIAGDELTESEMKALAASCLPNDGRMVAPSGRLWELYRSSILHELSRRGALTPSQKSQFYEALVDVSMHVRPTTWVENGIPLAVKLQTHPTWRYPQGGFQCKARIEHLSLSTPGQSRGLEVGTPAVALCWGRLTPGLVEYRKASSAVWNGGAIVLKTPYTVSLETLIPVSETGEYETEGVVILEFFDVSAEELTRDKVLYKCRREIRATTKVLAAEPQDSVSVPTQRDSYPVIEVHPPYISVVTGTIGVAFDVQVHGSGGRQATIGTIRQAKNTTVLWDAVMPPTYPKVDWYVWVLTPNANLAKQTVDITGIWGEEIRLRVP